MQPTRTIAKAWTDSKIDRLTLTFPGHTPHWQTSGPGHGSLQMDYHREAEWISLVAEEHGEKSSKTVMLTLHKEDIAFLKEFLK